MIQLNSDEIVVFEIRKHWFYIFWRALALLIVTAIIAGGVYLAVYFSSRYFQLNIGGSYEIIFALGFLAVLLIAWMSFFAFWTKYYLDYWVVTNERIVDVDLMGFFHQETAVVRLDQIQDVTIRVNGFFQNIFGFGTIQIQTAGESREFIMPNITNPEGVKETIFRLQNEAMEKPKKVEIAV
ncbi:MAG: hypothetical protein A2750_00520 [Candidatus Yanofskybacteria bacterium RIFCSPHIGHO2_01_FULL_45_42]|nr:MAG: hypothetical protein A2750_00520 [Candidatus Yanofskybacteria bacterium RIFCSPHIGHO2_01_FULL_45_42]OGN16394.1 MAG: hypothetical protein A3C81_02970 [Candidatus Yanofskybacteria bacterium RIFCSPHIGHO2_02_FULL_46_19]OGN27067.1 MAG: hypothetical protein A3B17_02460 [Candidatus Yanofskybacteria bacterium RIFCSPLOWO2_01_FULL_45_72]